VTFPWWQGLVLGLVQGLTEFLPVSSSGHLVVAEGLVGFHSPGVAFEVSLHVATLLSVLIVYRLRVTQLVVGMVRADRDSWRYAGLLVLASVPAAVVGLAFRGFFEEAFDSYLVVGIDFLLTAVILFSTRWAMARAESETIRARTALGVGCAQAVAILPGISRSGTTIAAALWAGVDPAKAADFSFLMAVIAIGGSGLLEARHLSGAVDVFSPGFVWAFLGALVSGVIAIRSLVWLLRRRRFDLFAPYCAGMGLFTIVWFVLLGP
jgi:undecaprenyl-diphosphatase